ncbi:hypothetical protein ACPOL_4474 [Acidisarcina polymorpha]|uniref:Uncharacterized protein n=1 Tax=Acidisarcina polymorpha TaxID=2211140 RepID=A0A2Z5G5C1_9BACT|nr:hypothetical protein [Acidisarcina polymorpha]AXC13746.1 hypothetical protein ACPOL_4474 [Acidisarcina polymorpha]
MKRFLAIAVICSASAFAADQSTKPIDGWISDSMCGAKHVGSGAACVKKCVGGGAKPVFVDDAKKQVWTIDNPDAVAGHYGHHVAVQGTINADEKSVHVASLSMLKDQGDQAKPDEMGGMSH